MDNEIDSMVEEEIARSNEAFYAFTDKIVTLSTGALTLLIVFRNSLTGNQPPIYVWLLQVAWIGFMLAVLTGILWYLSKYRVHRDMAKQLRTNRSGCIWEFVGPKWYYHLAR